MWDNILIKPLQLRAFRDFRVEILNLSVDYKYKSTCEDVVKTTGVSNTNYV